MCSINILTKWCLTGNFSLQTASTNAIDLPQIRMKCVLCLHYHSEKCQKEFPSWYLDDLPQKQTCQDFQGIFSIFVGACHSRANPPPLDTTYLSRRRASLVNITLAANCLTTRTARGARFLKEIWRVVTVGVMGYPGESWWYNGHTLWSNIAMENHHV